MQPGDAGKIPIKIVTKSASGPLTKSIRVMTNIEGTDSNITLQIKGEVWQAIEVKPRTVAFGRITPDQVAGGSTLIRKVTVVNNVEGELKLGELKCTNAAFKATVAPVKEGREYEITVELVPPLKPGNNTGRISATTGVADSPTLDLAVYAMVVSPIEVSPPRVTLNPSRTEPQTVQLYVRSNVNKPFKVSDLQPPSEAIKVELTDVKDSQTYRLSLQVSPEYLPKAGDEIAFATDDPSTPRISVPIVAMTRPPTPVRTPTVSPTAAGPATRTIQPSARTNAAQAAKAAAVRAKSEEAKAARAAGAGGAATDEKSKPAGQ